MKCTITKLAAMCALAFTAFPLVAADPMPRSEWHSLVGDCAQNPQTLKQTIGKLSAADQLAFLGEVNAAIEKMPGSDEAKGAAFLAANRAAVTGASRDNLAAVLAEVFATVPPEYLTEINERFASDLFSRTANPARVFTDQEFIQLATNTMAVVNERCQKAENSSVRETFAILMFLRASGGTPADLAQTLVSQLPDAQVRETALNEWIKPAMGDGQEQSYDAMLGASQAGEEPDHAVVAALAGGVQVGDALLGDLAASGDAPVTAASMGAGAFRAPGVPGAVQPMPDIGLLRVPRAYVSSKDGVGGSSEGSNAGEDNPYYTHRRGSSHGSDGEESGGGGGGREPGPYRDQ